MSCSVEPKWKWRPSWGELCVVYIHGRLRIVFSVLWGGVFLFLRRLVCGYVGGCVVFDFFNFVCRVVLLHVLRYVCGWSCW